MNKLIISKARRKFEQLQKKHKGFINIIADDWRGFCFIYDTIEVRRCQNKCSKCPLYKLLEKEKNELFSAKLRLASRFDKKIFGQQNFLNCKTFTQYRHCYLSWLINKTNTPDDIKDELKLLMGMKLIYSVGGNTVTKENDFKFLVVRQLYLKSSKQKRVIIKNVLNTSQIFKKINKLPWLK